jgi:hypothetical protein
VPALLAGGEHEHARREAAVAVADDGTEMVRPDQRRNVGASLDLSTGRIQADVGQRPVLREVGVEAAAVAFDDLAVDDHRVATRHREARGMRTPHKHCSGGRNGDSDHSQSHFSLLWLVKIQAVAVVRARVGCDSRRGARKLL